MEIRNLSHVNGLDGLQTLSINLSYLEELLVDYELPTYRLDIDLDGALAYAAAHDTALCDLSQSAKNKFIKIIYESVD